MERYTMLILVTKLENYDGVINIFTTLELFLPGQFDIWTIKLGNKFHF